MANLKFLRYKTTSEFNAAKTNKSFKQGDIVFDSGAKILYIVTDDTPTLEPYYGNNAIKDVSCSGDTITVTLSDGSTKSIAVNNVVSAGTASKLSTNAGSATQPIYFKDGVPTAITGSIANNTTGKASTAGTADYATKLGNSTNSYTYSDVWNQFTALTTADTNLSNRIGDSELAIGNKLSEIENNINDITDWQQKPTADEIITNRLGVLESINIGGTILDKTEYQGNAKTATTASSAASASKLTSSAGSATLPVYFDGGIPKVINTTDVGISITGSATSATKATQDANGNVITETYATKTELADKSNSTHTHLYAGSDTAGGTATKAKTIATEVGTTNVNRPVFFAYNGDTTKVVYDNDFVYNPATNTLTIGTGTLTGTNYSGTAAKADSAATAGVASKTQAALTFGSQTFDGSSAKTITAADLGLSSALKFLGTTTTALSDAATTNPITINGANVTAQIGNVVLYGHLEFLWNGSSWEELGDENSFALKSIQIKTGDGLSGSGALDGDVTISHADTSSQASMTTGGRTYINSITLDDYGHVTALGTGTETDQTTVPSIPWAGITSKPTTLSGYGITDGMPTYTVNVAQTDLTWIKAIAAKKANRMSFYYNYNGAEWSYLLGCRNTDADDSLTYGSILKFGYTDTYLRILRIISGSWKSSDWEKISAGYADTSGSCSGNAATATSATTSKAITINTDAYSNTADSCMPTGADTFAVYRIGANSGATGADGNIIAMTWASSGYYGSQIYVDCDPTGYMAFRQRDGSGTWTVWRNIIHSGNISSQSVSYATSAGTATSCSGSAASLATSRTLWGQSFNGSGNVDGTIRITTTTGDWTEGIRIKPYYNGWTTILLGGTDLSADTGTSTNSWSLHTYAGNFFINRNNSNYTTPYLLCNVSGNWGMGTNAPAYKLDVQGTLRATGATTLDSSLSVTGDIAAKSNVNVTNQTKSKTFSINGGCTLEYDSTNECVKFVF